MALNSVVVDCSKPISDPDQVKEVALTPDEETRRLASQDQMAAESDAILEQENMARLRQDALDAIAEGAPDTDPRIQAYRDAKTSE